jgi:hypothetical protein
VRGAFNSIRESIVSEAWASFSAARIQGNSQGLRDRMTGPQYPLLSPPRTRGSSPAAALEEPLAPSSLDPRFRGGDTEKRQIRGGDRRSVWRLQAPFSGANFHDFKGFRRDFGSFARVPCLSALTHPHGNIVRCAHFWYAESFSHSSSIFARKCRFLSVADDMSGLGSAGSICRRQALFGIPIEWGVRRPP